MIASIGSGLGPAIGIGLGCALVALLGVGPVLRRLPEPELEPDETKVAYAALVTRRFGFGCALLVGVASGLGWALPEVGRPLWLALGTLGVLLAVIDARTTWLPLPLTRAAWLLMGLAGIVVALTDGVDVVLRAIVGAAAAGLLYLGIWLVSRGGFGFGDVRFAPLIGAATGAVSYEALVWALLLGSFVGAVHGLARLGLRRRAPFPYAPAMLAGGYLALVVSAAVRT